jgi:hypothetical protein
MISGTSDCSVGVPLHTNELAGSARGLRLRDEEDAPVHLMLFQFGMRGSHLIHRHCSSERHRHCTSFHQFRYETYCST